MKAAEAKTGMSVGTVGWYGLVIGEVVETRIPYKPHAWGESKRVGVKVRVTALHGRPHIKAAVGDEVIIEARKLDPANSYKVTSRIEALEKDAAVSARVAAAQAALGIISASPGRHQTGSRETVTLSLTDLEDLAQRIPPRELGPVDEEPEYPSDEDFEGYEGLHDAFEAGANYAGELAAWRGRVIPERGAARVALAGYTVELRHTVNPDGEHALELEGVGCELEGEEPGVYYPRGGIAEELAAKGGD